MITNHNFFLRFWKLYVLASTKINPENLSNHGAKISSTLWDWDCCRCLQCLIMNFEKCVHQIFLNSYLCSHVCSQCHQSSSAAFSEWLSKQWWSIVKLILLGFCEVQQCRTSRTWIIQLVGFIVDDPATNPARGLRMWPVFPGSRSCLQVHLQIQLQQARLALPLLLQTVLHRDIIQKQHWMKTYYLEQLEERQGNNLTACILDRAPECTYKVRCSGMADSW